MIVQTHVSSDMYSYPLTKESSKKKCYSAEASMKMLISEEISKRPNTRQNAPSLVARLMGVDILPFDSTKIVEVKKETTASNFKGKEHSKKGLDSSGYNFDSYSDHCYSQIKLTKPKRREHPQEEELQKFKKEFEACQAARFKEYSKVVDFGNELKAQNEHHRENRFQLMNTNQKLSYFSSSPTKIVILRPGIGNISEDSWNSTPTSLEERDNHSIQDFLQEVKERLKFEVQGKSSRRSKAVRRGEIETLYQEKPSEPRQIAHRIAQQVRDCVTRDLGINLLRSESTRSYKKSDTQLNGACSPEFVNRDNTRRLLTERFQNVLKGETHRQVPLVSHKSSSRSSSLLDYDKLIAAQSEIFMNDVEKQSRSFRQDSYDSGIHHKEPSPGNLIRSLSAPVSGASFGKLLLEDRHILTGAHIRRKHEVVENVSTKHKKDKFNIKEKVSSFGYSLTLRGGRLFRRRVQSVEDLQCNQNDLFKDINSGPTVMMSFCGTHENFTEVPPSPASVCSSVCDELWRPAEESEMSNAFSQINSNLNGLEEAIIEEQPQEVETEIEDPAQAYIRDLLVASGLYDGSCDGTLSKWDSLSKPISHQVGERCGKDDGSNLNHNMILDLVNEALLAINPVHKLPHGMKLLNQIWENVGVYLHPPLDRSYYALDNALARDMKADRWPKLMRNDISVVGKDLECHIIDGLIEEILFDD